MHGHGGFEVLGQQIAYSWLRVSAKIAALLNEITNTAPRALTTMVNKNTMHCHRGVKDPRQPNNTTNSIAK
jgi:hypothetical protein